MNPRLVALIVTAACTLGWTDANAATRWQRSPWACNDGARHYTARETRCVVRRVFHPYGPRVVRQALHVLRCESWDGQQAYPALGPMQFLRSTWNTTPYRHRAATHPVWNVLAARWLYDASGRTWQQWTCAP